MNEPDGKIVSITEKNVESSGFLFAGKFVSRGVGKHMLRVQDNTELIYVVSGVLSIREEAQEYKIHPGEFLYLDPGKVHEGSAPYPGNLSFFWAHFSASLAHPKQGRAAGPERMAEYFRLLLVEAASPDGRPSAELLMRLLICETRRGEGGGVDAMRRSERLAAEAAQIIQLHFNEDISTADIAERLNCNPDYLGRVFRRVYPVSLLEMLIVTRLDNAAKLLRSGNHTVKEILYASGFNDPAYFRRQFFRRYAMRPRQYRALHSHGMLNTE